MSPSETIVLNLKIVPESA